MSSRCEKMGCDFFRQIRGASLTPLEIVIRKILVHVALLVLLMIDGITFHSAVPYRASTLAQA